MLLRRREFAVADSLLDVLFDQDKHIKSLYSIAFALYFIFLLNLGAQNYLLRKRIFDLDLLLWSFERTEYALLAWFANFGVSCWIYMLRPRSGFAWLIFGWIYMFAVFLASGFFTLHYKLPLGSAMIVMAESVRIGMKTYAYIYGNVMHDDELEVSKKNDDPVVLNYPYKGFQHFLYFMFCPSMVYRKEYPLRDSVRWGKAARYLIDAFCCVFFLSMVWINTSYNELHSKRYSTSFFIHYFALVVPGTMIAFLVFYGFLHSWLNFTGELLRHGDRRFYSEWWTASTYSEYYRRWNAVVYDWIYAYLFSPLITTLIRSLPSGLAKALSAIIVIWISAIVHEIILACSFGFFYPILMVMYAGPGILLFFVPKPDPKGWLYVPLNVTMWFLLMIGYGLLLLFYCDEYYMRMEQGIGQLSPLDPKFFQTFTHSYSIENYIAEYNKSSK